MRNIITTGQLFFDIDNVQRPKKEKLNLLKITFSKEIEQLELFTPHECEVVNNVKI
jgi:hypothetical protein